MSIFEKASRYKLRFSTSIGQLSAEDLWELPLTSTVGRPNLDRLAVGLSKLLKSGDDVSFVEPERKPDESTQLAFDIVKHIIDVKLEERKKATEAKDRADKKQRILEIMSKRQDAALEGKPDEELQAMLATL